VPTNASWLNRIEAQCSALRSFTLDGTDHPSHSEQASTIRRHIAWRNRHTRDRRLGKSSTGQTLPDTALVHLCDPSLDRRSYCPEPGA
jgi:hypothetical protein